MFIFNIVILFIFSLIESIKNNISVFDMIVSFGIIFIPYFLVLKNKDIKYTKKNIIVAIIISIIISIFSLNTLNFNYKNKYLVIENISKESITIEGIYLDEKLTKIDASYDKKYDKIMDASEKTEYKEYNKITSDYKMTLRPNRIYEINISKVKNIEIDFQRLENSYKVLVNNKKIKVDEYIYHPNKKANTIYDSSYKVKINNLVKPKIILTIIYMILLFYINFNLLIRVINDKKYLLLYILPLIVELNYLINISSLSKIGLLCLTLYLTKYKPYKSTKLMNILYFISSLLISFTFIGDRIINNKFSVFILVVYLLASLYTYLLFPFIISTLDSMGKNKNIVPNKIIVHRIILFIITLSTCLIYHKLYNPYIIHVDGYMELRNIKDHILSNWHPYLHTIYLYFFQNILGNLNYLIYFRYIIYSLLLNSTIFKFNKNGLSLVKCYLISILLTIFPVTQILLLTINKDIDFTLALVISTYYLFLFIKNDKPRIINNILLIISLLIVTLFRHNGIYIFIVTVLFILIYSIKNKRNFSIYILIILSVITVYYVNGPLYKQLKVEPALRNNDIIHLIHSLDYAMINNKTDEDVEDFLTKYMSKEEYITYYDKYNVDLLQHYTESELRNQKMNKLSVIKLYLKQLLKSPKEIIDDRLYGTDQLWNNSERDNVRVYKYQLKYDEFDDNFGEALDIHLKTNKKIDKLMIFISNNELLNLLSFRTGIYIDILIILLIYSIIKRKKEFFSSIPIFINIITLMLVMAHQEYRYLWAIELCTFLLYLIVVYDKKESN